MENADSALQSVHCTHRCTCVASSPDIDFQSQTTVSHHEQHKKFDQCYRNSETTRFGYFRYQFYSSVWFLIVCWYRWRIPKCCSLLLTSESAASLWLARATAFGLECDGSFALLRQDRNFPAGPEIMAAIVIQGSTLWILLGADESNMESMTYIFYMQGQD